MNAFFNCPGTMFQLNAKPNQPVPSVSNTSSQRKSAMKKEVHIHIGEYRASSSPLVIKTLVGSCIAVCLYDPQNRIGGMNHILLPGKADFNNYDSPARFGMNAMELLINRIMNLGGNRFNLVAKIFGGANVVAAISSKNGMGKKNSEFVLEYLHNESIKIIGEDIGGNESRRIYFHTDSGTVFIKRIKSSMMNLAAEEKKALTRFKKEAKKPATIEMFQNPFLLQSKKDKP